MNTMSENDSYEATLRKELAAIEAKKTTESALTRKIEALRKENSLFSSKLSSTEEAKKRSQKKVDK